MEDSRPRVVSLDRITDPTGEISVVEAVSAGLDSFRRAYLLHSVAAGEGRGGHAHKQLWQLLIAASGSFDVEIETAAGVEAFHLADCRTGLLLGPLTWRTLHNFSPDAVCLVLASDPFDEADYIRDYDEFKEELSNP